MILDPLITHKASLKKFKELPESLYKVHKNKYDYSTSVYKGIKEDISVICSKHGEFITTVDRHLRGSGCPSCMPNKKSNTIEFVQKAEKVHGTKYDYSKVEYKNNKTAVIVICPKHGEFKQKPSHHLKNNGCAKCTGKLINTTQEFIEFGTKKFKGLHTYENTKFIKSLEKVSITCSIHGVFEITPNSYQTSTHGCPTCAGVPRITTFDVIKRFTKVHFEKYDYSLVDYISMHKNVKINCLSCGNTFNQTPRNHLNGNGCRSCNSHGGFDKNKPGILYYLSIMGGKIYKIGITNKTVVNRFSAKDRRSIKVIKEWHYSSGFEAALEELRILQKYSEYKYLGPPILESGNTELFNYDVLGLDIKG